MDRNRQSEIRQKLLRLGREHGLDGVVPERGAIYWMLPFNEATQIDRNLAPRLSALRDRFEGARPALVRTEDGDVEWWSERNFDCFLN